LQLPPERAARLPYAYSNTPFIEFTKTIIIAVVLPATHPGGYNSYQNQMYNFGQYDAKIAKQCFAVGKGLFIQRRRSGFGEKKIKK
jgi:hypothetical protein